MGVSLFAKRAIIWPILKPNFASYLCSLSKQLSRTTSQNTIWVTIHVMAVFLVFESFDCVISAETIILMLET